MTWGKDLQASSVVVVNDDIIIVKMTSARIRTSISRSIMQMTQTKIL